MICYIRWTGQKNVRKNEGACKQYADVEKLCEIQSKYNMFQVF